MEINPDLHIGKLEEQVFAQHTR